MALIILKSSFLPLRCIWIDRVIDTEIKRGRKERRERDRDRVRHSNRQTKTNQTTEGIAIRKPKGREITQAASWITLNPI